MASTSLDEQTINDVFDVCEKVIFDVEEGKLSKEDLGKKIPEVSERLDDLQKDISALTLFSDNEFFEELPTSSVKFLLVPFFKAICHLNSLFDVSTRYQELKDAKINFMEFLQRLQSYEVITFALPWNLENDEVDVEDVKISRPSGEELRKEKLRRSEYDRNIKTSLIKAKEDFKKNPDNDQALREIYLMQLRQSALRALSELEQIETELPFAKRMIGRDNHPVEHKKHNHGKKLKPFILTRNDVQKQVFGLGYPAIPTVTVDEWAQGMVDNGHWGSAPSQQRPQNDEEEEESDSEEARQRNMRMDEYRDTHRRGWGNTHNKG
ncbi:unnamed protein product, partial [Mesorhabditis belari]|uniref:Immunoglobulin-binding protein 1 n=1 Tax=Mesorhabditis belari TaxID=2138241 RepID=A0AAF3EW36_9BILA